MAFTEQPEPAELVLDTELLTIRPLEPSDAADAYELLTHPDLAFLDPSFAPASAVDFAEFAERVQGRAFDGPDFRRYVWAVRFAEDGTLVGLMTADCEDVAPEYRSVEITAYVHPEHQRRGYFSASVRRILGFTHRLHGLTHQKAMIRWDNTDVADMTAAAGLVKQPGQTPQGYETWIGSLPALPDS